MRRWGEGFWHFDTGNDIVCSSTEILWQHVILGWHQYNYPPPPEKKYCLPLLIDNERCLAAPTRLSRKHTSVLCWQSPQKECVVSPEQTMQPAELWRLVSKDLNPKTRCQTILVKRKYFILNEKNLKNKVSSCERT